MIDYVKNLFKVDSSSNSMLLSNGCNVILGSSSSNVDLVLENASVNRSLSLIVNSIINLNCEIFKNGVRDVYHESLVGRLLFNPSDSVCFESFLEAFVWNYLVFGNAYILLRKNDDKCLELVNLPSSSISVYLDKDKSKIVGYSYTLENKQSLFIKVGDVFPFIGHFKNYNPKNPWYGYSLLEPIRNSATLYQKIDRHNLSVIENGSRPSGILSISPNRMLTEEQKAEFAKKFREQSVGPDQAGQVFLLNGDCQWQPLSNSAKDMDYSDTARRAIRSIASGLGVPPNLVGDTSISGENTRANLEASFEILKEGTTFPIAKRIASFLTVFFRKHLDPEIEIRFVDSQKSNDLNESGLE